MSGSDASRDDVIKWCIGNDLDLTEPIFPPPEGWAWCDPEDGLHYSLTSIFTITDQEDVEWLDLIPIDKKIKFLKHIDDLIRDQGTQEGK